MSNKDKVQTEMTVGAASIKAYSRLPYTMWHALAEFIDNSTQSRENYDGIIDDVLAHEGEPLTIEIIFDRINKKMTIEDNSIGMTRSDLIQALKIANPTSDSKGRSKYGMGMKTAAFWIGSHWQIVTTEFDSEEEWTADVNLDNAAMQLPVTLTRRLVDRDTHYTKIIIQRLNRYLQKRTEETIRSYLGSMYRFDLKDRRMKLLFNNEEINAPDDNVFDTDPSGNLMKTDFVDVPIGDKKISGWVAVLKEGFGGRKFGGFSLFQNMRQIQGFPNAWKPRSIFGGIDDEGANNLVAQRITGLLELEDFQVSHTKDAILFEKDEEEELEAFLTQLTKDYSSYARRRRSTKITPWSREKVRDLAQNIAKEFATPEMADAVAQTVLPPLESIIAAQKKQVDNLDVNDEIATYPLPGVKVVVSLEERSEFEPYVNIIASATPGTIHVIINRLHPYYDTLDSQDEVGECIRQYIFDAVAEYKVAHQSAVVRPENVRRFKDTLLRTKEAAVSNAASTVQEGNVEIDV